MAEQQDIQTRAEKLSTATTELTHLISEAAEMLQKVKQVKFHYLTLTCDVYTRMDYPSIMMDSCEKDIRQIVPTVKEIREMKF